jgi:hypothetical protein
MRHPSPVVSRLMWKMRMAHLPAARALPSSCSTFGDIHAALRAVAFNIGATMGTSALAAVAQRGGDLVRAIDGSEMAARE